MTADYSIEPSTVTFQDSGDPNPCSLNAPTRATPLVKVYIPFSYVEDWPPLTMSQSIASSSNSLQRGNHFLGMHKTCPNRLHLLRFYWGKSLLYSANTTKIKMFKHQKSSHILCPQSGVALLQVCIPDLWLITRYHADATNALYWWARIEPSV